MWDAEKVPHFNCWFPKFHSFFGGCVSAENLWLINSLAMGAVSALDGWYTGI